jgi:hypothetical protein
MRRRMMGLVLALAASTMVVSVTLTLRAQDRAGLKPAADSRAQSPTSVQDALLQPFHFTFTKPTPLEEVAKQLGRSLNAPVAIDRAALDRQGLKIDDAVQLDLQGVRLKTGLKLLLDQLDLTYKVVPEDNLLVITDATGSTDPLDQVLTEVKTLHRDVHEIQDALDEIRTALGLDAEGGPRMHKPTIIEEMPPAAGEGEKAKDKDKDKARPKEAPPASSRSRSRPGA